MADFATLSPDERRQYEYDLKKARDYNAEMSYARKQARKEGLAEGRAEGRAEGQMEERIKNARNLKKMGISLSDISKALGLSEEEIIKL